MTCVNEIRSFASRTTRGLVVAIFIVLLVGRTALAASGASGPAADTPSSQQPTITAAPALDPVSDSVGATVAQFRVDEGGNATYSVPIQIPLGTAGVAPKLALTYNSHLSNGPMGPGWAIEGASLISRCRQTRENGDFMSGTTPVDGNPAPVNFTTTDRFCLDGVRLLVTVGSYGVNGSIYAPENDPTTRVTATVSNVAAGPDSFVIQRKDGTTSSYGNTTVSPSSRVSATVNGATAFLSWSISRMQDSTSNYIDYLYLNQPAAGTLPFAAGAVESVLSQVNYTGHLANPVVAPYASVIFNYTTLPVGQVRLGNQAGVAFLQSQQLASVSVQQPEFANATDRFYRLSYATSVSGSGFAQLNQIKECRDATQGVCFPPTVFTWSAANYTLVNDTTQNQSGPDFTNLVGYKVGDIDGDGRQDFVWAKDGDGACPGVSRLYVSFLDRTATNQMTLVTPTQAAICTPIDVLNNDAAWLLLDYDGDGRADLLMGGAGGSNWVAYASQGRPIGGGRVFGATNLLAGLATPITVPAGINAAATLIDVNGDGLPDLLYAGTVNIDGYEVILARLLVRQNGALTFSEPYGVDVNITDSNCTPGPQVDYCDFNFFTNDPTHKFVIGADVNGDGRGDLTMAVQSVKEVCTPICPLPPPGATLFNGTLGTGTPPPPSTDSVHYIRKFYWYQFVADGISQPVGAPRPVITFTQYWGQSTVQSGGTLPNTSDKLFVVDLNGDGLSDILYQDRTTATTYWALINTGNGYQAPISVANISTTGTSPPIQLADINGDGRLDLVYYTSTTSASYVSVAPSTTSATGFAFTAPTVVPGGGVHAATGWIGLLGDFDGDGAPDFLAIQTQATSGNLYASRATPTSRYHPRDVIASIVNGFGATTALTYQPLTNKGVYQPGIDNEQPSVTQHTFGYGSPVFDVLAPIYVVSQVSSSAPLRGVASAQSTVYYRYQAALMQAGGRGFLGFWQTYSFDANDQASTNQYIVTENGYGQSYPFIGMPLTKFVLRFSGALTRGSAELDACAANPETLSYNCFAPVGAVRWPILRDTGTWLHYSGQQPYCSGQGCTAPGSAAISQCTNASTSVNSPAPAYVLDGLFAPPASPGPIFSYIQYANDAQYDPDASGAGNGGAVPLTGADTYTCYEDAWANLTHSHTITRDSANAIAAQKLVANSYTNDTARWLLGRLTHSGVQFLRPGQPTILRISDFTYDLTSGLLTSERIQQGLGADQDLRTLYTLDALGNRTAAYQCSSDLTDTQCSSATSTLQQPLDGTGHSGTLVHRYAKTLYDTRGRYSTGSSLPFYSATAPNHLSEQTALSVTGRDEFGNATQRNSINGLSQTVLFGAMGRPYYASDNTGKASTTTYRLCSSVTCPSDAQFRSQTVTAGTPSSWTYYDVLGRPILAVKRAYDLNAANQQFAGSCSYYDSHNRPVYVSEPFFVPATLAGDGSPSLTSTLPCSSVQFATTTTYDVIGRVTNVTHPDLGAVLVRHVGLTAFTTDPRGFTWEQTKNALGETTQMRDPDVPSDPNDNLTVNQTYDATGDVLTITRDAGSGVITTSATYDVLGRKQTLSDPDAGFSIYSYNAAGEVVKQTDAKNQTIQNDYDAMGRVWRRTAPGADGNTITDTWTFDTATNGYGQIANEARSATTSLSFGRATTYDASGRFAERTTSIAGVPYLEITAYDAFGRPLSQRDASGYTTTSNYSAVGYLQSLTDSRVGTIYEVLSMTARGQVAQDRRGANANLLSAMSYVPATGRPLTVCAGAACALQDLSYSFDPVGNLTQRARAVSTQPTIEQASYDALNRLTSASLTKIQGVVQTPPWATVSHLYDKLGNICNNNGVAYSYAGRAGCTNHGTVGSPHAVTSEAGNTYSYDADGNLWSGPSARTTSWNALNQLTDVLNQLVMSGPAPLETRFDYAPDGGRFRRIDYAHVGDSTGTTTFYVGNVEILLQPGGAIEKRRYFSGIAIDYVRSTGSNETRYVFSDHLGSPSVFVSATGTQIEAQSFDAMGNRRDPVTWRGLANPPSSTTQGYTGHEQIDGVLNLVHMNGRIYDPQIGRMLQPDPLADGSAQGLNRYTYVVNNPLSLTDPTGYSWLGDFINTIDPIGPLWQIQTGNRWAQNPYVRLAGAIVASYFTFGAASAYLAGAGWSVTAAGIGAGAASGFVSGAIQSQSVDGGLQGAFSGALFGGIGGYFGNSYSVTRISVEGVAGGVVSTLEGGKFGNGFLSAGVSSALMPQIGRLNYASERIIAAAVVGGTVSVVTGGKFANGAATGAFQATVAEDAQYREMVQAAHGDGQYWSADVMVDVGAQREDSWVNIFGHVSMATTDSGMYSFGTDTPAGSSVTTFVASQADGRDQTLYTFQTTPEQDAAIQSYMAPYAGHMNDVGYIDNCAARTFGALSAAGINPFIGFSSPPSIMTPGLLGYGLQNAAGVQSYYIPQGGHVPDLSQFNHH